MSNIDRPIDFEQWDLGQSEIQALQLQGNGCSYHERGATSLYAFPIQGLHPIYLTDSFLLVNKVRHEFRQIFFEMGFEEMPTNR